MYNISSNVSTVNHVVIGATNSISVLVCLLAAIMVLYLKLHKMMVYRLALYQVLASLVLALVQVFQAVVVNYGSNPEVYRRVCTAIGWFTLYAEWMKLLFTAWVTLHIFCYGVLHKNLNRLESLYVSTSLLLPVLVASIPLATRSYGLSLSGSVCFIYAGGEIAFVERLTLLDGPALLILILASTAMVVMVIRLARLVHLRSKFEPISDGDQFMNALKQLLPLAAFPILFFIFFIPVLVLHIYVARVSSSSGSIETSAIVFLSLWSLSSGLTLIVHLSVAKRRRCCPIHVNAFIQERS